MCLLSAASATWLGGEGTNAVLNGTCYSNCLLCMMEQRTREFPLLQISPETSERSHTTLNWFQFRCDYANNALTTCEDHRCSIMDLHASSKRTSNLLHTVLRVRRTTVHRKALEETSNLCLLILLVTLRSYFYLLACNN